MNKFVSKQHRTQRIKQLQFTQNTREVIFLFNIHLYSCESSLCTTAIIFHKKFTQMFFETRSTSS